MTFQEALISVIQDFGKDVLLSNSLLNILNDYNAFSKERFVKNVIRTICENGYMIKLLHSLENNSLLVFVNQCSYELYNEYGISKDITLNVLNSIIIGLGHSPINIADIKKEEKDFIIDSETEKRLNNYLKLLDISYTECGEMLIKQGKFNDAVDLYKIGVNNGDLQCLVELVKLYMSDDKIENDDEARKCCNMYFNSFLDVIGDGNLELSDIKEEHLNMYARGFHEIIPIALHHNKTKLFHSTIEYFIVGVINTRLYQLLSSEMNNISNELTKLKTKHDLGLLSADDYSYLVSSFQQQHDSIYKYIAYLQSLIDKTKKFEGQQINLNRIKII
jgi:hypothetical protein